MWVNPNKISGDNGLIRSVNGGGGTGRNLHYLIRNSRFHFGWYSIDTPGSQILTTSTWYHVVFQFSNDNRQQIWINGVLDAQGQPLSGNPSLVDGKFYNGGIGFVQIGFYSGSSFLNAQLPITRIYNRALSEAEILQNWMAQKARFGL